MITIYEPKEAVETNPLSQVDGKNGPVLLMKGAPEALYRHCRYYFDPANPAIIREFGEKEQALMLEMQETWSGQALRVLLLACRPVDKTEISQLTSDSKPSAELVLHDLILIGLVGIVDPPREETAGVVDTCRKAGIRFFMVTGDSPLTAAAIAENIGIFKGPVHHPNDFFAHPRPLDLLENRASPPGFLRRWWLGDGSDRKRPEEDIHPLVGMEDRRFKNTGLLLSGPDLTRFEDFHWDLIDQYEEIVFARTTPEQKYTIVKQLQKRKNVVAVTGDGVNDTPALKNAHIGIGMGNGSDAAMEAASLVLLDSNLGSIITALRQGRVTFENLKKVVVYLLPGGTFSELLSVLTNIFFGLPAPLSSFLMM